MYKQCLIDFALTNNMMIDGRLFCLPLAEVSRFSGTKVDVAISFGCDTALIAGLSTPVSLCSNTPASGGQFACGN